MRIELFWIDGIKINTRGYIHKKANIRSKYVHQHKHDVNKKANTTCMIVPITISFLVSSSLSCFPLYPISSEQCTKNQRVGRWTGIDPNRRLRVFGSDQPCKLLIYTCTNLQLASVNWQFCFSIFLNRLLFFLFFLNYCASIWPNWTGLHLASSMVVLPSVQFLQSCFHVPLQCWILI